MKGGLAVKRFAVLKANKLLKQTFWGYDGRGTHGICIEGFDNAIGIALMARSTNSPMIEVVVGPRLTHDDLDALIARLQAVREQVWPG